MATMQPAPVLTPMPDPWQMLPCGAWILDTWESSGVAVLRDVWHCLGAETVSRVLHILVTPHTQQMDRTRPLTQDDRDWLSVCYSALTDRANCGYGRGMPCQVVILTCLETGESTVGLLHSSADDSYLGDGIPTGHTYSPVRDYATLSF